MSTRENIRLIARDPLNSNGADYSMVGTAVVMPCGANRFITVY